MFNEKMVLCASNAYEKKYYLNDQFSNLPERVKQELQIMCVLFLRKSGIPDGRRKPEVQQA